MADAETASEDAPRFTCRCLLAISRVTLLIAKQLIQLGVS